jgi:hypothetical protein
MAKPNGDYYFYHKSLKTPTFDPTNPDQFKTTVWLEVEANQAWKFECNVSDPHIPWHGHPRGGVQIHDKNMWQAIYARHKYMTAMVGRTNRKIKRYKKVHGQFGRDHLWHEHQETIVVLVPVDMPTPEEKYLWVDMTYPLRAVYFPKLNIASPRDKDMCVYSRLNLLKYTVTLKTYAIDRPPPQGPLMEDNSWARAKLRQREIERRKKNGYAEEDPAKTLPNDRLQEGSLEIKPEGFLGWGIKPQWTVRFDVEVLMHILSLPESLLKPEYSDPYKFVALFDCRWIDLADGIESFTMNTVPSGGNDSYTLDYLKVVEDEKVMRLSYTRSDFDSNWVAKTFGGLFLAGVSLIPVYGPIAALGGQFLIDLLTDPDKFTAQNFSQERLPLVVAALGDAAKTARGYIKLKP